MSPVQSSASATILLGFSETISQTQILDSTAEEKDGNCAIPETQLSQSGELSLISSNSQEKGKVSQQDERILALLRDTYSSPIAKGILKQQRENCTPNTMIAINPREDQNPDVFCTPGSISIAKEEIGKGACGTVYHVERHFNDGRDKQDEAIKISKKKPSNVAKTCNLGEACNKINAPTKFYKLNNSEQNTFSARLALCAFDLWGFKIENEKSPIRRLLGFIKDTAAAAQFLHERGLIHRDIKPENILINKDKRAAQLGDLDLMIPLQEMEHFTACTPTYTHSSVWDNDLIKQANRNGRQTPADDVFALGRTIQYGVIRRVFTLFSQTSVLAKRLNPVLVDLSEETETLSNRLRDLQEGNKVCSVINMRITHNLFGEPLMLPAKVLQFPSRVELKNLTAEGLNLIKDKLDPSEYQAMELLAKLANDMQDDLPDNRPTMAAVGQQMGNFKPKFEELNFENLMKTPSKAKRARKIPDAEEEAAEPAKKRSTQTKFSA